MRNTSTQALDAVETIFKSMDFRSGAGAVSTSINSLQSRHVIDSTSPQNPKSFPPEIVAS